MDVRSQILEQALILVPTEGWNDAMLARAVESAGLEASAARAVFPGGAMDCLSLWLQEVDREMVALMTAHVLPSMKIREKIFMSVKLRLQILAQHREVARRTLAALALPWHGAMALETLYRTVDTIWKGIGDRSTDFNFYTKRMILAGVYSKTLLFWLNDSSENYQATWDFLQRRIDDVMQFEKVKARVRDTVAQCRSLFPFRKSA